MPYKLGLLTLPCVSNLMAMGHKSGNTLTAYFVSNWAVQFLQIAAILLQIGVDITSCHKMGHLLQIRPKCFTQ